MSILKYLTATVIGTALTASLPAQGHETNPTQAPAERAETTAQPTMRAYIDPKTGTLVDRPVTAGQKRSAAGEAQRASEIKVTKIEHPNGMRQYMFNGAADEALIATRRPDGTLEYRCSEHGIVEGQPHPTIGRVRDDR